MVMKSWRFQWPFRWPITWTKPPLPDLNTLRWADQCNDESWCSRGQWVYRPTNTKMGFCYQHLQKFDWIPNVASSGLPEPESIREYERGSWRDKGAA